MAITSETIAEMNTRADRFDLEAVFRAQYGRVARLIARVVQDPSRAEELAVEVFLKLWRKSGAHSNRVEGWLYRTAVRAGLDELKKRTRREKYERLLGISRPKTAPVTPEEVHSTAEEQRRVRGVLSAMERRQAEFLLLRSHGFSYVEVAAALEVNPASVGTLLSRAQAAFRKEYIKRYGQQ